MLAERAGIDRALAYDVLAASAAGAPFVGYKRAAFVDPEGTPVAFSLALAEKDLRLIGELADAVGRRRCRRRRVNLESIRAAGTDDRVGRRFRQASRATCVRRAGDDRRPCGGGDSSATTHVADHDRTRTRRRNDPMTDRSAHQGRLSSSPRTPSSASWPSADVLVEGDTIAAVGPEPVRGRRTGHRRDRRHRHPGLHRHPSAHLGDVDPDVRAGLRADHLLRRRSSTSSRRTTGRRRLRGQPVGLARVHQRGHHDARRLVAHHEHAGPCRRAIQGLQESGIRSVFAYGFATRRSSTGGSARTTPAAS